MHRSILIGILVCFGTHTNLALGFADDPIDVVTALETAVADAIAKAQPSVVSITRIRSATGETTAIRGQTSGRNDSTPSLFIQERPGFPNVGNPIDPESTRSIDAFPLPGDFGGGVIIGSKGEILTNYHLVKSAGQIRVRGAGFVFDAEILAADPRSDLAVIAPRLGSSLPIQLKPLPVGDADQLRQGSFLIALGNGFNAARDGKASASLGILSNVARKIDPPADLDINMRRLFRFQPTLIQLDNRLNLGMSGAAVINIKGELVALSTAGASPAGYDAAAGYAIPMDVLGRRAVKELIQGKEVEYSFIGITLDLTPNTVKDVQRGTPAFEADLATGDRILEVGGKPLTDDESALPLALALVPVGQPVALKVLHEGKVVERTMVMSKYPASEEERDDVIATNRPAPWRGARIDFASVLGDPRIFPRTLDVMSRGGVGVVEVSSGSIAEAAGVKKGVVIRAVGGKSVRTPAEFREAVKAFDGQAVELTIVGEQDDIQQVTVPPK